MPAQLKLVPAKLGFVIIEGNIYSPIRPLVVSIHVRAVMTLEVLQIEIKIPVLTLMYPHLHQGVSVADEELHM